MNGTSPHEDDRRAGLPPPRFSLAALMWGVTCLAVIFASLTYLGSHGFLLLLLLAVAIVLHVAGNALGTRLRASGDRPLPREDGTAPAGFSRASVKPSDFAPATPLSGRHRFGWPRIILTLSGVVLGGAVGGYGLTLVMTRATWQAVVLGVVASAILGGIWTFLAASLIQVACGAAWQASSDPRQVRASRRKG